LNKGLHHRRKISCNRWMRLDLSPIPDTRALKKGTANRGNITSFSYFGCIKTIMKRVGTLENPFSTSHERHPFAGGFSDEIHREPVSHKAFGHPYRLLGVQGDRSQRTTRVCLKGDNSKVRHTCVCRTCSRDIYSISSDLVQDYIQAVKRVCRHSRLLVG